MWVTTSTLSHSQLARHPYQCPEKQCIKSSPWSLLSETHGHLSQDPTDALPRTPPHTPIGPRASGSVVQQLCWPHIPPASRQPFASSTTRQQQISPIPTATWSMTVAGTFDMLWTSKIRRPEVLTDFLNHESTILYSPLASLAVFLLL